MLRGGCRPETALAARRHCRERLLLAQLHEPHRRVAGSIALRPNGRQELGEIDEDWFSWGTASLLITDLGFDSAEDEDWFVWFADDDPGDDPNIAITVEGDVDMYFIVEMYVEEWDTTTPMATVEGWETVYLSEDDFEFEGGWWWSDFSWDNIYVRIQTDAEVWDKLTCEDGSYDILIES